MLTKNFAVPVLILGLTLIDLYIFRAIRSVKWKWGFIHKKAFTYIYWAVFFALIVALLIGCYVHRGIGLRSMALIAFFVAIGCGLSTVCVLLIDDVRRLVVKLIRQGKKPDQSIVAAPSAPVSKSIPRSEFLVKAGILAGALPLAAIRLDMKSTLYDYQVKYQTLYLPNLPKAFDGLKLGQISDLHSGSLFNPKAVAGGVDMLMREKPDLIFFTGDLVNDLANEMNDYFGVFSKVKAPLGVYSCLGNHDYGDYSWWATWADKDKNHADLINCHKNLGWNLLLNENRRLKVDGEEIGILGMENWGLYSRLPKYGRMDLTAKNTADLPVKLLLSHDPSHWQAEVVPKYPQMDVMFSGHTHGMQFGVQTKKFQWSPVEFIYKEWAGLYHQGNQQLYVNVGYGFIGLDGRVGILPEITIFTLKAATAPSIIKAS